MKENLKVVTDRIIRTDCGELLSEAETGWNEIIKTTCMACRKSCLDAAYAGYRVVQVCLAVMLADRRILTKDFIFKETVDIAVIEILIKDYLEDTLVNAALVKLVKYYVISEDYKIVQNASLRPNSGLYS